MFERKKLYSSLRGGLYLCLPLLFLLLSTHLAQAQESVSLVGAGSTVPLPLYAKWSQEFNKINHNVQMQYQPLGTSEGIKLISGSKEELGKTDFSAGEVLLTEQERASGQLLQLPAVIIAIVPIYNLPGNPELKFSGELLAQIFLGHVKTWNAPQIAKLNPGVNLPAMPIKVVYRPGGKGSNYVFSDFLSKTSPEFRAQIGRSASPKWPVGVPAERSSDMADKVKEQPGAVGYVELQYAIDAGLPAGMVENAAGKFIKASEATVDAACKAVEAPDWKKFSAALTNASGADSYPIASFSWLYLRSASSDHRRRTALVNLLKWIYGSGQEVASSKGYFELPSQLRDSVRATVETLN